ncbi:hypothetical protein RvY_10804 [Ramazzottius varieornatus]|uniref:RBR-type E3 ubiquitin transferase n=1 Tax=Ramazzottius varieornatus TaxID=947166 RepID=A0A1D1VGF5_RAMVA|nr:hypothetical protein RvY_10804 [Ramazzottius varieornatus]
MAEGDDDYYDCYDDDADEADFATTSEELNLDFGVNLKNIDADADPEAFSYTSLTHEEVKQIIRTAVEFVRNKLNLSTGVAKNLLIENRWNTEDTVQTFRQDEASKHVPSAFARLRNRTVSESMSECSVCYTTKTRDNMAENTCGHSFCASCWNSYLESQVAEGKGFGITCMDSKCDVNIGEDFVMEYLTDGPSLQKYERNIFRTCVESNPSLSHCPTNNCDNYFFSSQPDSKRVVCDKCQSSFCFVCGSEYHLPCCCRTIRQWWKKVMDDADTSSYISSHTKDCPNCESSIEKNGGCNHLICRQCKYEFCWVCLEDWKSHGAEYYVCNRFNAKKAADAVAAAAEVATVVIPLAVNKPNVRRLALNKYLFYLERWKNHEQSLRLEENLMNQIHDRVQKKVQNREGSLIDWQYLMDAGKLLLKCRRALQYTYPFAYYLEDGPSRMLFEHLQAELESTIENLSFTIEQGDKLDVAALQAQMRSAEFRRRALFRDAKEIKTTAAQAILQAAEPQKTICSFQTVRP